MTMTSLFSAYSRLSAADKAKAREYVEKLAAQQKTTIGPAVKVRKAGFLKGTFQMLDGFDAPLEDFKAYME